MGTSQVDDITCKGVGGAKVHLSYIAGLVLISYY